MVASRFSTTPALSSQNRDLQEQFLRFHLVPDTTVMLPVSQLTEVLTIPLGQIVPIPSLPPWVMGVFNWRGEVLWMVDLGHLLGLTPWHQQSLTISSYRAIVLHATDGRHRKAKARNQMLGLVVSRVEDMEWCNADEIQSPPASAVLPGFAPFLRGYWLKDSGEMVMALDGEAIASAMPKS